MNFTLQRVRLDSQGYANGGRHYYGIGFPPDLADLKHAFMTS
jgi:hypothetical protein